MWKYPITSRLVAAVWLAAAAGGCKATLAIRQYPRFYDPKLKSVAVVGFANRTLHPKAGEFLAQRLADALRANGTYEIVGPAELNARLTKAKLTLPAGTDAAAVADVLRKLGGIQAFVTGTVKSFAADRAVRVAIDTGYDPWYSGTYGYGYHYRGWGYGSRYGTRYPTYRQYAYTEARVSAVASLVRVESTETIHATPGALTVRMRSAGDPPRLTDEVLMAAAEAVAHGLVDAFAVVPMELEVSKGKTLRTARRRDGGRLDFTDDFRADQDEMLVIVRLPPQAARNPFRVAVTRKKHDEPLAERRFEWSAKDAARELTFSPRKLAEAAGPGKFELRLYCNEKLVLERGFRIEKD